MMMCQNFYVTRKNVLDVSLVYYPDMGFDPEKITFFAKTDARGKQVSFGIKAKDRQRHMYVVGKTGMGKSTLLENMAAQDIQNGEGMAFIDPHGQAAETLLDYVPEHRINDVIYFAPFDLSSPISFNVMEDVGPDKRHLVVSGLMSTFKKIWVDAWSARMEYILTNALLALIEYPDTTLLSVNRLFSDKAYRERVVDYIKDPAVKAFWTEEFANYTDRFAAEALPAIQNKIGQFTGNPLIRNIIGQPHSSFDIRKIMDEKKILIMNLSKGLVGETNANLLGSMLTTRIYLAAMSRADLPVEQMRTMPNFYFYVDEFQSFANATFANILSEARKYHLNLIIAHQYIEQMEEDVRNAVFGNVGTTISFRVGPFDAEVLETVFSPRFLATDLVNLGFAQIYLTLMIDGIGSQPFSAITLPPVERPPLSCKGMTIAASRRNYTKDREVVEKLVSDLHTPVKNEPSGGKKNNYQGQGQSQSVERRRVNPSEIKSQPNIISPVTVIKTTPLENQKSSSLKISEEKLPAVPPAKDSEIKSYEKVKSHDGQVKAHAPKRSVEDLRSVLSRISEADNNKNKITVNTNNRTVSQHGTIKAEIKSIKPEPSHLRNALAEVLKRVDTKDTDKTSLPNAAAKSAVTTAPKLSSVPQSVPEITSVSEAHNANRVELERLAAEADAAFENLKQRHESIKKDDPLAVKKIERLFKPSGTDRSPFAS